MCLLQILDFLMLPSRMQFYAEKKKKKKLLSLVQVPIHNHIHSYEMINQQPVLLGPRKVCVVEHRVNYAK